MCHQQADEGVGRSPGGPPYEMLIATDLRYAIRALRRTPIFTLAAGLTLTLGIGANTLIFSVVDAELLRPLPFREPGRLVEVAEKNEKLNLPVWASSVLNYLSWKEQSQSIQPMGAIGSVSFALTGKGNPEQFNGNTITPSLFPLLGVQPVAGRAFLEGEDKPQSQPVAMISEGLWRRRFGSDPKLIGSTLTLNGIAYTVVGIAPPGIAILANGDILTPLAIDPGRELRLNHLITTVGRLKPGVTLSQAQAEMDTVFARLAQQYPEIKDWGIRLVEFSRWLVPDTLRMALLVVMGTVSFVLLIACANVANLFLARASSRQREVAIRTAVGASRGMVVRQFLTESVLLSLGGGIAGVLSAMGAVRLLSTEALSTILPIPGIAIDRTVLLFSIAVTFATGLLFGLAPALSAAKTDLSSILKQGSRTSTAGFPLLRNGLVAGELALATALLICAGLLLETLLHLEHVALGFHPDNLLTFQLSPPDAKYPNNKAWPFYERLLDSLNGMHGIRSAAISSGVPFGAGTYSRTPVNTLGKSALPPGEATPADWRIVSPGYFQTLGIPILKGRDFTAQDRPPGPLYTLVSDEAAKRLWGDDEPLGRIVRIVGSGRQFTVIGVVGGVRNTSLNEAPVAAFYRPAMAGTWPTMDVVLHTQGQPEAVIDDVRRVLRGLDPEMPMANIKTMDEWLSTGAAQPRVNATLVGVFAGVALLIAVIGIYGVLSYSVSQRTREIGVRMAIGAREENVLSLILRQGMIVTSAGIVIGVVSALVFSRVLESIVFGIQVRDPVTFVGAAGVLGLAAVVACYIPARRASRMDPIVALRED
jgi:putative ABC transport system permease protein